MAAKKKDAGDELKLLKLQVQEKKVVIGTERVLKYLKTKKLGKVFLACNCPQKASEDVKYYAQLAKVPVVRLEQNNEELGVFCKKNFFISVLGTVGE